jgi:hypothetical protein
VTKRERRKRTVIVALGKSHSGITVNDLLMSFLKFLMGMVEWFVVLTNNGGHSDNSGKHATHWFNILQIPTQRGID